MNRKLYALVLAGGSGERFWPLSRRMAPKQLLSLFSDETLLEATLARLEGVIPPERVLVLTNTVQEAAVRRVLPQLPPENIVAEPARRDTAAAIALGVGWVAARDPQAMMVVLPADHLIEDRAGFARTLEAAAAAAEQTGALVTIGIRPEWACPSFGYIELGEAEPLPAAAAPSPAVHRVCRFCEKPSREVAETFLARGNFRWNAGMFAWSLPDIRAAFAAHTPELAAFVTGLERDFEKTLRERFPTLPKISIDYAVMEKAERVLVVEAAFAWDDVGGWVAASKYWPGDDQRNAARARVLALESSGNIVYTADQEMQVALLGVRDLIVVQTADALLVCHRDEAEKIKSIVPHLPEALR